jgi:hypothetical protein
MYISISMMREIDPNRSDPNRCGHKPKMTAPPFSFDAKVYTPKQIEQTETGKDWKSECSPYKWLPGYGMNSLSTLFGDRPTM